MIDINGDDVIIASVDYDAIDLSDLDFEIERHRESLRSFARMSLDLGSVKPALRARDIVFVRIPSGKFRIGIVVTEEMPGQESDFTNCEAIHQTGSLEEANAVCGEVERYFLRHFPGRTLHGDVSISSGDNGSQRPYTVYVASYAPEDTIEPQ